MFKLLDQSSDANAPNRSDIREPLDSGPILAGLVRAESLAQELGISLRTLSRWNIRRTGPPRTCIGRSVFYDIVAVREWLSSRREHAPDSSRPRRQISGRKHAENSLT